MSDNKKVIAFSSADSYLGGILSRYTAINSPHDFQKIRGLIRNESCGEELKKVGIEPHVIDYEKPETLEKALQGVHSLVFVIENDEKRVHEAEQLVNAIKKANVSVLLISCAATEHAEGKRLREFKEIEEKVAKIEHHHIFRITWPYQLFFLWTRMIQNEGKLRLAVPKDGKFTPIDIRDVGKAVHKYLTSKKWDELGASHNTCVLTGPETIKAGQVVDKLNTTVQANVEFEETTKEKLKEYLESLKKGQNEARESEDYLPHPSQITGVFIELILEGQDFIKQGKAIGKTDDLKKIIGKEGDKLEVFFKDHQQYFKPRK